MILLVDAGNTRLKWAAVAEGGWRGEGALPIGQASALATVVADWQPGWAAVCCVAGPAVRADIEAALAGLPSHWLSPAAAGHGVVNRYRRPEALGADRYAGLIACRRRAYAPCVLASAGTALTVDALTGDGEFLGGMILPGAALMRQALLGGTAGVADVTGAWADFPAATGDAVATGILTALTGAITAMRGRLVERGEAGVRVVLTGGDAEALAGRLPGPVAMETNLVLEGLLWLARDLGVAGA